METNIRTYTSMGWIVIRNGDVFLKYIVKFASPV